MKRVYLPLLLCVCIQLSWGQDKATEIRNTFLGGNTSQPLVVAHRADWHNAPENSLQGIQDCIDMGVDIVEIDLKKAKDGHPVLIHDKLINHTMNGRRRPEDYTSAELKALRPKNGAGCKTRHQILTFKEVMTLCKGKIMVNVDKGYDYFKGAYATLEKTGMVGQCMMKAGLPYEQAKSENGDVLDKMISMPTVNLQKTDVEAVIDSYLTHIGPKASELVFSNDDPEVLRLIDKVCSSGARIFINSLWPEFRRGHDDDRAVELHEPDESWGWIISRGAKLIQTDRPALLPDYLRAKKLHNQPLCLVPGEMVLCRGGIPRREMSLPILGDLLLSTGEASVPWFLNI